MQYLWESTLEVRDKWLDIYFFLQIFHAYLKLDTLNQAYRITFRCVPPRELDITIHFKRLSWLWIFCSC